MAQVYHQPKFQSARRFSSSLASLCAAVLAVIGIYAVSGSHAAVQQLYLTPSTTSVLAGQTFTVAVYTNTGGESVNAAEPDIIYNPAQLQYVAPFSNAGSVFPLDASDSINSGSLQFYRSIQAPSQGQQPANVNGTGLILTVTFRALVGSGSTAITFGSDSQVLRASDSSNIVTATGSANITLTSPATPTPTAVPTVAPTPVHTPTPTVNPVTGKTPTPTPTPVGAGHTPTPTPAPTPVVQAGTAAFYLSPGNASVSKGTAISVAVRVKTTLPVNAVETNLTYPSSLTFDSISGDASAFPLAAQNTGGGGIVTIARSITGGAAPVNGDALVATVKFIANSDTGSALVGIATSSQALTASGSSNIAKNSTGGTYTLTSGSSAVATPIATTDQLPPGAIPIILPLTGSSDPVSVNGTIVIEPSPNSNATSVVYQVDGHTVKSGKIDTTYLSNGSHTVTAIVTDSNGHKQTITLPISVNNKLTPWQSTRNTIVAAFGGNAGVALGTIITLGLLLLAAVGFLVIWPHLQASSMEHHLFNQHVVAEAGPTGFPAASVILPAGSSEPEVAPTPEAPVVETPVETAPEVPAETVVEPSAENSTPEEPKVVEPEAEAATPEKPVSDTEIHPEVAAETASETSEPSAIAEPAEPTPGETVEPSEQANSETVEPGETTNSETVEPSETSDSKTIEPDSSESSQANDEASKASNGDTHESTPPKSGPTV